MLPKCAAGRTTWFILILADVFVLCSVIGLAQGTQAAPPSNVTGFWVFRVPTGDGNFRESFFDLKQSGETVTGKLIQGSREMDRNRSVSC